MSMCLLIQDLTDVKRKQLSNCFWHVMVQVELYRRFTFRTKTLDVNGNTRVFKKMFITEDIEIAYIMLFGTTLKGLNWKL